MRSRLFFRRRTKMLAVRRWLVFIGAALCSLAVLIYYRDHVILRGVIRFPTFADEAPANDEPVGGVRWDQVPTRYPVQSLTPLPPARPRRLPKVQFEFHKESEVFADARIQRRAAVKMAFERCWEAYRAHAWGHDELGAVSGGAHDESGGWAVTLVESLDTLWIMGLKDEFDQAVQEVVKIDLSSLTTDYINVFETTVRHLGGLLAAYDLSGDKRLLRKAKEFGEMLLVAFDTPNRMPITRWDPQQGLVGDQEASDNSFVAEMGALSLEFTRLSQITGDTRWYDAANRVTRLFAEQQTQTLLPGMWPVTVNPRDVDLTQDNYFSLGTTSNALYEHFLKMHALLGGTESMYEQLYESSMNIMITHGLFRPMTKRRDDILFPGIIHIEDNATLWLEPQAQHQACSAGGMFALGSKLLNRPDHLNVADKLTKGCIWAYKTMPLGIMPDTFTLVACEAKMDCVWDEGLWESGAVAYDLGISTGKEVIREQRLRPAMTSIRDRSYKLRPEAIESIFVLYRVTGDLHLMEVAWTMFRDIMTATETVLASAPLRDVSVSPKQLSLERQTMHEDLMGSHWMAETLKYFYLMFSDPEVISLDDYVLSTAGHPLRRPMPAG